MTEYPTMDDEHFDKIKRVQKEVEEAIHQILQKNIKEIAGDETAQVVTNWVVGIEYLDKDDIFSSTEVKPKTTSPISTVGLLQTLMWDYQADYQGSIVICREDGND